MTRSASTAAASAAAVCAASVVALLAVFAVSSAAAAPTLYDAADIEEMADYAPRGKRVMLPLSKFAFLPEKIQIGLDQAGQNARGKRVMLPLSKFAFLPEKINIDVAKSGGAARRSSKRNPSDDIDQVREIVRQYNRDSQWNRWLRNNAAGFRAGF